MLPIRQETTLCMLGCAVNGSEASFFPPETRYCEAYLEVDEGEYNAVCALVGTLSGIYFVASLAVLKESIVRGRGRHLISFPVTIGFLSIFQSIDVSSIRNVSWYVISTVLVNLITALLLLSMAILGRDFVNVNVADQRRRRGSFLSLIALRASAFVFLPLYGVFTVLESTVSYPSFAWLESTALGLAVLALTGSVGAEGAEAHRRMARALAVLAATNRVSKSHRFLLVRLRAIIVGGLACGIAATCALVIEAGDKARHIGSDPRDLRERGDVQDGKHDFTTLRWLQWVGSVGLLLYIGALVCSPRERRERPGRGEGRLAPTLEEGASHSADFDYALMTSSAGDSEQERIDAVESLAL